MAQTVLRGKSSVRRRGGPRSTRWGFVVRRKKENDKIHQKIKRAILRSTKRKPSKIKFRNEINEKPIARIYPMTTILLKNQGCQRKTQPTEARKTIEQGAKLQQRPTENAPRATPETAETQTSERRARKNRPQKNETKKKHKRKHQKPQGEQK